MQKGSKSYFFTVKSELPQIFNSFLFNYVLTFKVLQRTNLCNFVSTF